MITARVDIPYLPVPPQLVEAIGYPGGARFVAVYWDPTSDQAMWNDGRYFSAWPWRFYLHWLAHPAVGCTLAMRGVRPKDFGGDLLPASAWLLLDTWHDAAPKHSVAITSARCLALPVEKARGFLRSQWPSDPLTPEKREAILQELEDNFESDRPTAGQLFARGIEEEEKLQAMVTWLKACPVADSLNRMKCDMARVATWPSLGDERDN